MMTKPESSESKAVEALRVLADRTNWTAHGLSAMHDAPLLFGHFDPIELCRVALDEEPSS